MNSLDLPLALLLLLNAGGALAQQQEPQDSWMIHLDSSTGTLRYLPDMIVLKPGGTVQLMVFGQDHGKYTITLDADPSYRAEVDTANPSTVHVAEFAAPTIPGTYAFHDEHHPEMTGTLTVGSIAVGPEETTSETGGASATKKDVPFLSPLLIGLVVLGSVLILRKRR